MTLRRKVLIFVGMIVLFGLACTYFSLDRILLNRFAQLDDRALRADMQKMVLTFEHETENLKSNMIDYSASNSTYDFMQKITILSRIENDPYIQNKFNDAFFQTNNIHFIALLGTKNQLIYNRFYDVAAGRQTSPPDGMLNSVLANGGVLIHFEGEFQSKTGVVATREGPMLVVSLPVIKSTMEGPIQGALVVGRYLDAMEIERLTILSHSQFKFQLVEDLQIPAIPENTDGTPFIWLDNISSEKVIVHSLLKDVYGNPYLVLSTEKTRDVYNPGQFAVKLYALVLTLIVLCISIGIMIVIDRMILKRIEGLVINFRSITRKQDFTLRICSQGADEFAQLEKEFNTMMSSLEGSRNLLEQQANYDPLTLLPNRALFFNKLESAIKEAKAKEMRLAVLFIDLDRFKWVNDTWGHDHGDDLLKVIATRLQEGMEAENTVSRLGGDEFTVLLTKISGKEAAYLKANQIHTALASSYLLKGRQFHTTASIGISIYPDDGSTPEELVKYADIAMIKSKESGRNHLSAYSNVLLEDLERKIMLETQLASALFNDEFHVFYQPIVDAQSLQIVKVEALLRWEHPVLGWISPSEFIPIAETSGAIITLGNWVLSRACSDIKKLKQSGHPDLIVTVNVSVLQLEQDQFLEDISSILQDAEIRTEDIELEITESVTMSQGKAAEELMKLLDLGVRISVDDFGTGYSSLSYLRRFPLHTIKIDKSFIAEMTVVDFDRTISKAIIDLGHHLQLKVVAEGIETEEHFNLLKALGCDEIQGYYISRPLDFSSICKFFEDSKR
ncbi:EAL domain-containing protein [Paenibacillus frigoriresistens]|uniref:sensor domain-containing diguanylate cyclase n=1 Tax=Paenibacillus alginolyticus TaxID=59839 RepID=UPI001562F8B1|nr:EAL domain-containing protein [Paenibacillus frigoriresistens]NRF95095.1 EAL domain-containing protein [Paenibacillus frigoriresistens]